jgi:hypothetical protein
MQLQGAGWMRIVKLQASRAIGASIQMPLPLYGKTMVCILWNSQALSQLKEKTPTSLSFQGRSDFAEIWSQRWLSLRPSTQTRDSMINEDFCCREARVGFTMSCQSLIRPCDELLTSRCLYDTPPWPHW